MVEKFLLDLFRRTQKQKIAVLIDGEYTSPKLMNALPILMEKLREFGDIKLAEVIYESKISESHYKALSEVGFTQNVVAGNLDLHFLYQCYDLVLSDKSIDMIVVGTEKDNLIPLFTEMRKETTTYALLEKHKSKSFEECFDGIIILENIDEFTFVTTDISEVSSVINMGNGDNGYDDISSDEIMPDANIGPISETLVEQTDLIEELKKQEKEIRESEINMRFSEEVASDQINFQELGENQSVNPPKIEEIDILPEKSDIIIQDAPDKISSESTSLKTKGDVSKAKLKKMTKKSTKPRKSSTKRTTKSKKKKARTK